MRGADGGGGRGGVATNNTGKEVEFDHRDEPDVRRDVGGGLRKGGQEEKG